jgi:hypothetical protein
MTVAYDPRTEQPTVPGLLTQPHMVSEPLVDGDLCDISTGHGYCHEPAAFAAVDADGGLRILCRAHTAKYFPTAAI